MSDPKWLYRLESIDPENGLWYNTNNVLVWGIGKLQNCKTKDLPMGYDERYHKGGRNWYSSCSRKEDLTHWYSLQDALDQIGIESSLETPIEMTDIAEPFVKRKALKHLNKGRAVIFACGTGHPYFSTDTCAALRAVETESDIILCGKTIDAVYSADPKQDPNAIRYEHISFQDVLEKNLKVMDATAIALCRDNNMPIRVFAMADTENIVRLIKGEKLGTLVDAEG